MFNVVFSHGSVIPYKSAKKATARYKSGILPANEIVLRSCSYSELRTLRSL